MSVDNEIHQMPLPERLVDAEIRDWLDLKFGLLLAQVTEADPEWKILKQARHVQLDGYSYDLTPRILNALRRAGLLGIPGGRDTE